MAIVGYIRFDKASTEKVIEEELTALKFKIAHNMREANEVASGNTLKSLDVKMTDDGGTLWGRSFFAVLETGRGKGGVPRGFIGIILKWMKAKGIHGKKIPYKTDGPHKYTPQQRGDIAMAASIAHVIQFGSKEKPKGGTALFRQGGRADIYSNEIPITLQRIDERLFRMVHTAVYSIQLNTKEQFK